MDGYWIPKNHTDPQRLDKALADAGAGTRKEVKRLIRAGLVTIDDEPERNPSRRVRPGVDHIAVQGLPLVAGATTFMLNKPKGVVTATADPQHKTVVDLFPDSLARHLFPAGRLDKDTEGLLILTTDGDLCHRLISPKHGVQKEYLATVDGDITPSLINRFAQGVTLDDGYQTLPASLEIVMGGPPGTARVVVTEGKYHQIKRMFAACGLLVTSLRRLRIGALTLDHSLEAGGYRELTEKEVDALFN